MENKIKEPDWVYMLKGQIYLTLNSFYENGKSLPCKLRTDAEERIVSNFRKKLSEAGYEIVKKPA